MVIMAIAGVGLLGTEVNSTAGSTRHRALANEESVLVSAAEAIKHAGFPTGLNACKTLQNADFTSMGVNIPSGYTVTAVPYDVTESLSSGTPPTVSSVSVPTSPPYCTLPSPAVKTEEYAVTLAGPTPDKVSSGVTTYVLLRSSS
ncbi:MAG TPA: hypothetical protein VFA11_01840 [Acidimicrobiales bacterium]|nr:hypothetical protein [Acidimicrobiales bacterium]